MKKNKKSLAIESRNTIIAQNRQLAHAQDRMSTLKEYDKALTTQKLELKADIDKLKKELKKGLEKAKQGERYIPNVTTKAKKVEKIHSLEDIKKIETNGDWNEYSKAVNNYALKEGIDFNEDLFLQILPRETLLEVEKEFKEKFERLPWNSWDYGIVGIAALVGVTLDFFVVKMPLGFSYNSMREFLGTKNIDYSNKNLDDLKSPLTEWLQKSSLKLHKSYAEGKFEDLNKVPFDTSIESDTNNFKTIFGNQDEGINLTLDSHRLKTLGHDPLLGLLFGTLDNMNGTLTGFGVNGGVKILDNPNYQGMGLFKSFIRVVGHFLSDVGSKQSLPAPLFSLTQAITFDTPIHFNNVDGSFEKSIKFNELTERMYAQGGYNFQHFLTMSIVPLSIELIIRSYMWLNHPTIEGVQGRDKLKMAEMLAAAHSLAMGGNILRMGLNSWNPLAFNMSEFMVWSTSVFKLFKERLNHEAAMQREITEEWHRIYNTL